MYSARCVAVRFDIIPGIVEGGCACGALPLSAAGYYPARLMVSYLACRTPTVHLSVRVFWVDPALHPWDRVMVDEGQGIAHKPRKIRAH
jgi:hypothetical protein